MLFHYRSLIITLMSPFSTTEQVVGSKSGFPRGPFFSTPSPPSILAAARGVGGPDPARRCGSGGTPGGKHPTGW